MLRCSAAQSSAALILHAAPLRSPPLRCSDAPLRSAALVLTFCAPMLRCWDALAQLTCSAQRHSSAPAQVQPITTAQRRSSAPAQVQPITTAQRRSSAAAQQRTGATATKQQRSGAAAHWRKRSLTTAQRRSSAQARRKETTAQQRSAT